MSRSICLACNRPKVACICAFTVPVANQVEVVILQHPREVNHTKGTLPLLSKSLAKCRVIVAESFDDNQELLQTLNQHTDSAHLLYPSEDAESLVAEPSADALANITCLVLLDATWRKAYKMYQLSQVLHALPHIKLPDDIQSLYQIRKTSKEGALSTLEACCHALSKIEGSAEKYQPLLNSFVQFNQFQLSFRTSKENDKN